MNAIPLTVYLPDTRGVTISPFGLGNAKIGPGVYTYSKLPGRGLYLGSCPGSTAYCEAVCYAKRVAGPVHEVWRANTGVAEVPEIPADCRLLRIHVSGDFDSEAYVLSWLGRLEARPDIVAWAYTRSWRVPTLLPALERLRALPHLQLFASMDPSTAELPPAGWRRAWIWNPAHPDPRIALAGGQRLTKIAGAVGYACPEETGHKPNCVACGYCLKGGKRQDVIFLEHGGPAA